MSAWRWNPCPHRIREGILDAGKIVVLKRPFHQRKVNLFKIKASLILDGQRHAVGAEQASVLSPCGHVDKRRNLAGGSVRQHPGFPVTFVEHESAPELHDVCADRLQHRRLHHGQLLDHVIDVDVPDCNPQIFLQPRIGDGRDAGRAVPAEIDRNQIRLLMLNGRQHFFP